MNLHDLIAELDPKHGIRIGGQTRGAATTFEVDDPATGALIAEVADAGVAEAAAAVDAASAAFRDWAASPPRVRSEILRRAYDLMIAGQRLVDRPDLC